MKKILILFGVILLSPFAFAQELNEATFDFWVGQWEAIWTDENGAIVKAENSVDRILDGKVIQEQFKDSSNEYEGRSFSIYNTVTKEWNQSYVDNNGIYFHFIGSIENGDPVFKTLPLEKDGKVIMFKMVFRDITETSFVWEWMGTKNDGKDWNTLWKIDYRRI
jgi:hypothetical protein